MALKLLFNPISGAFDYVDISSSNINWLAPVATFTSLPLGDPDGACRVVKDQDAVYTYDNASSTWIFAGKIKSSNVGATPNTKGYSVAYDNTLTLQPADDINPGVLTAISQTIGGNKTFNGDIIAAGAGTGLSVTNNLSVSGNTTNTGTLSVTGITTTTGVIRADGGIDVTATGGTDVLNIGTSGASDVINIGNSGATVNIQGTTLYQNVTNLNVADKLITINSGGSVGSATGSGIQVEENAIKTGYVKTSGDRASWTLKAPGTAGDATITAGASGITLDQSSHNPITLAPVGAGSNVNGATISAGQVLTLSPADGSRPGVVTAAAQTIGGLKFFTSGIKVGNDIDLQNNKIINTGTLTLPTSTDTLVARDTVDVLTNKTLSGNTSSSFVNGAGTFNINSTGVITVPNATDTLVGKATTDTLSNKTLSLSNNTITSSVNKVAQFNVTTGALEASSVTNTELSYVSGVTSSIQTQLNSKPNKSVGDINETSFSVVNNQSVAANVTGLAFANASVRSFEALVSVYIDATSGLFESIKLQGIQKTSSWSMSQTSVGDASLITFSITTAGQIQYTSASYPGFVSGTIKFRAITTSV
jgi:hypothetical protein